MVDDTSTPLSVAPTKPPARGIGVGGLLFVALASSTLTTAVIFSVSDRDQGSNSSATEHAIYQCPMHPAVIQDHPGDCPICGMKLVKVDTPAPLPGASTTATPGEVPLRPAVDGLAPVDIDPARQQLIGLETVAVTRGEIGGSWRTVGRVAMDETRVRHVNLKVSGFVERIYVDFVGKRVRKGDPLFSLYSPDLLAAQEEYLLALRTQKALASAGSGADNGAALVAAARRKLSLWDVTDTELERVAGTGEPTKSLMFYSPVGGVVTRKDVVEGMKLDAGAMPYEIVDLSSVWVLADVYESELRFVKEGMGATMALNAFPDREFKGKVMFIDPLLDPVTRTIKVRLTFPNPKGELRPEMFGEVVLLGEAHEGLRVPQDAIIDSGTQKVVFVALGDGKFAPRTVKVGKTDGTDVEVLGGLDAGERVVTRANFLIDSESRLRASVGGQNATSSIGPKLDSARVLPATSTPASSVSTSASTAPTAVHPPTLPHAHHPSEHAP